MIRPVPRLLEFTREADWLDATVEAFLESLPEKGLGHIALSGGKTPEPLYRHLVSRALPWDRLRWWLGDERVILDLRNENMIRNIFKNKSFLDRFHPWPGEGSPEASAAAYELELLAQIPPEGISFHFSLLGIGEDGHTASLFPGSSPLAETSRWTAASADAYLGSRRLTLTYPLFNRSKHVWFLLRGREKEAILRRVIAGDRALPAARIEAPSVTIAWLRDP